MSTELPSNKTIFSGIQPSGVLHIGNYLGAIQQWIALQDANDAIFCIVDEHAITVPYDPKTLPDRVLDVAATYIAAGIDPEKSIMFIQSHVSAHTELAWLLSTIAPYGNMSRMTQFKEKSKKLSSKDAISLALFSYPVLMAADILLYGTHVVPVGEDQKQHIELTRLLAERFNAQFGETFTIPEPYISQTSARIMSLADATKKMSKSDAEKSYIALTDSPSVIRKKIASAVTDTDTAFSFAKSGPAVKNLLAIYKAFSGKEEQEIEKEFEKKTYKEFKTALADTIIASLEPFQKKYNDIRSEDTELRLILGKGMHRAQGIANATLHQAKKNMGLI
ncbi:MAG: tryptophan--tRNA ligase [Candidatus Andersenbacteria bacterium RIFCSPHIGHO2_12_FULL_45_11b]|uniref:Tryptophan--tRNA ligase n=1 Tax=Candidatus Andersenbacteria bacterium RIFCSPHIGHO2_12_FULL_45_11b TaxID=1797282 RepID=A0A1G1X8Z4_9BACT|nr:MAG: tryptophan--tRNA ligase [Candidatus Andersenbacteria bacterium RIFCSPHIGHO2_12_FULL_45_11b]